MASIWRTTAEVCMYNVLLGNWGRYSLIAALFKSANNNNSERHDHESHYSD